MYTVEPLITNTLKTRTVYPYLCNMDTSLYTDSSHIDPHLHNTDTLFCPFGAHIQVVWMYQVYEKD